MKPETNQWRITPMNKGGGEVVAMLQCYWRPSNIEDKPRPEPGQHVDKAGWVTVAVGDPESLETVAEFLNENKLDLWFTGTLPAKKQPDKDGPRWRWVRANGLCIGDAPIQYAHGTEADKYVDEALKAEAKPKGRRK